MEQVNHQSNHNFDNLINLFLISNDKTLDWKCNYEKRNYQKKENECAE